MPPKDNKEEPAVEVVTTISLPCTVSDCLCETMKVHPAVAASGPTSLEHRMQPTGLWVLQGWVEESGRLALRTNISWPAPTLPRLLFQGKRGEDSQPLPRLQHNMNASYQDLMCVYMGGWQASGRLALPRGHVAVLPYHVVFCARLLILLKTIVDCLSVRLG